MHNFMKSVCAHLRISGLKTVTTNLQIVKGIDKMPAAYCQLQQLSHNGVSGEMAEANALLTIQLHSHYKGIREVLTLVQSVADSLEDRSLSCEGGYADFTAIKKDITQEKAGAYVGTLTFKVWMRGML